MAGLDVAVNNAGVVSLNAALVIPADTVDHMMEANLS
jgi:NAD(P)-dependent dehydrogenase (short-subunit alcohol dehydrogenase family)